MKKVSFVIALLFMATLVSAQSSQTEGKSEKPKNPNASPQATQHQGGKPDKAKNPNAPAQTPQQGEKPDKAPKAKPATADQTTTEAASPLQFETLVIDFGDIPKSDKPVETVFRFKNTGKDPIILSSVQASCGCTAPEWTKDPVLPKKTGEIKVQYKNTHIVGPFVKTISVKSNKNPDDAIVLTIKGKVIDTATPADNEQ
ncbi:MAG: DUF1573 domain-containing protein [Bacteroidales bacterium]|jgi:uncharacterized protein YdeI (BOF family)|nr:DUF1573 domain-containing protein [Bacteroidales bacterium]